MKSRLELSLQHPHASYRRGIGPVVCLIEDGQYLSFSIYGWWYLFDRSLTFHGRGTQAQRVGGEREEGNGNHRELGRQSRERMIYFECMEERLDWGLD